MASAESLETKAALRRFAISGSIEAGLTRLPQCLTSAQALIKKSKLVRLANEIYLRLCCVAARYSWLRQRRHYDLFCPQGALVVWRNGRPHCWRAGRPRAVGPGSRRLEGGDDRGRFASHDGQSRPRL